LPFDFAFGLLSLICPFAFLPRLFNCDRPIQRPRQLPDRNGADDGRQNEKSGQRVEQQQTGTP
jgi:hypothetical protein